MRRSITAVSFAALSVALAACTTTPPVPPEDISGEGSSSAASVMVGDPFSRTEVTVDESQSSITFEGRSNIINHQGGFNEFEIGLTLDEAEPTDLSLAEISVTIDAASVFADGPGVEGHLKKADFFDVENFPEITFVSTEIRKLDGNQYEITGDLTIKGITRSVTSKSAMIDDAGMSVTFDVPRQEYGVGNDSYGDKLLEPMVPMEATVVFGE